MAITATWPCKPPGGATKWVMPRDGSLQNQPLPDQGIEAYRARVHHDNNPYQQDDWRNEEWWKGWEHEQQSDRDDAFDWHADAFRQPGTEVAE
ncbi:hypothetical protein V0242_25445 (plasmid) [Aeromonas hydrophila]|uniref:hypothetical protein n=1 Tax=Aeromonas hydrophila TaxID=644 RepID=UPI002ED4C642|nr:hypothetical protein V0242_25445 [Aeromonas hydrophila]